MRLRHATYRRQTIAPPSLATYQQGDAGVHIVVNGYADLRTSESSNSLSAGDFVLIPRSLLHTIEPKGSGSEGVELISGQLGFEASDHPLLTVLPPVIHATRAQLCSSPRCEECVNHLVAEVRSPTNGSDALLARLTDVLFIHVMRFFTPPPGVECPVGGWFSALNDPIVRRVLVAVHAEPGKPWTVASFADLAGESRSAFAAHFASVMREPPMSYLLRWRMFRGRALLRQTQSSLSQIADAIGYGSAAAFSLAFTREHGVSPGTYRSDAASTLSTEHG
jgi:AraC-like DNA-binding protein